MIARITTAVLFFFLVAAGENALAQNKPESCDSVYTYAENPPQFPGGMKAFYDFLKNFHYQDRNADDPVVGKFTIHLTIDKTGKPVIIQVTPESDAGLALQEYLHKMPNWSPATTKEGAVCYYLKIPAYIHFK
jgi:periplasmic protein TonB